MTLSNVFLVILAASAVLVFGQKGKSAAYRRASKYKPDLVPLLSHPMNGKVAVKNIGRGFAGPSKLTLDCVKVGVVSRIGGCPDLPPSAAPTYFDPRFPKNVTIRVPPLGPGATFTHMLSFWHEFRWTDGTFRFTAVADADHKVAESNTTNNTITSVFTVR